MCGALANASGYDARILSRNDRQQHLSDAIGFREKIQTLVENGDRFFLEFLFEPPRVVAEHHSERLFKGRNSSSAVTQLFGESS
jgi:hypothetical protein